MNPEKENTNELILMIDTYFKARDKTVERIQQELEYHNYYLLLALFCCIIIPIVLLAITDLFQSSTNLVIGYIFCVLFTLITLRMSHDTLKGEIKNGEESILFIKERIHKIHKLRLRDSIFKKEHAS